MTKRQNRVQVYHIFEDLRDSARTYSERTPIKISNLQENYAALLVAIQENNSKDFVALLEAHFITALLDPEIPTTYRGHGHTNSWYHQTYLYEPLIEKLFFKNNKLFQRIVSEVAKSDNEELHKALILSFVNTAIPMDIVKGWDDKKQSELNKGLKELRAYDADPRRRKYTAFVYDQLTELLRQQPKKDETASSQVKWLDYKLQFIKTLHSQDQHFVDHRGWKRVLVNIATIIFSAGILNLINLAVTGNFLFFNQTTTQSLIADLDVNCQSEKYRIFSVEREAPIQEDGFYEKEDELEMVQLQC